MAVQAFPSVADLLCEMDHAQVERAILLGWYWHNHDTCVQQNRFYADCVRAHPDRFSAFATLQPRAGGAVCIAELQRARDDGLVGLGELSPHAQGYRIDAPEFAAVLSLASEFHWPVNLHVTDPNSRDYAGRVETPLEDFIVLARTFPTVRFILAHWGGLLPLRDPTAVELANLYYDTAASPLLYDESVWNRFLTVVPADKVLFGSDYPLNIYPKLEVVPEMSRLLAEAKRAGVDPGVLGGNAMRMLPR